MRSRRFLRVSSSFPGEGHKGSQNISRLFKVGTWTRSTFTYVIIQLQRFLGFLVLLFKVYFSIFRGWPTRFFERFCIIGRSGSFSAIRIPTFSSSILEPMLILLFETCKSKSTLLSQYNAFPKNLKKRRKGSHNILAEFGEVYHIYTRDRIRHPRPAV